jgi:ubiquinone/menaquinone biosynthesis C-methylase UbiE
MNTDPFRLPFALNKGLSSAFLDSYVNRHRSDDQFYDAVMGDGSELAEHLCKLIQASKLDARNVLELGCGTGWILKHIQRTYEVSGLDTSRTMLSMARRKVPDAKLYLQNMVDFRIDDKF